MKLKWIHMYLDIAARFAQESHAVRLKVGAVFVSPDGVMSSGINGMPAGGSNICEDTLQDGTLVTKPELSHAEENCFSKMLRQGVSAKGGTLFLTHAPCPNCSRQIFNSGTARVYYSNDYRTLDGVNFLRECGILVERIDKKVSDAYL